MTQPEKCKRCKGLGLVRSGDLFDPWPRCSRCRGTGREPLASEENTP